ncbi:unnamed protein product [Caenorhabditis sp. 36 PRJEB53466]|nr:unnamed protein product [Caenorhabditis sp. 36 PRJEB53466]
MLQMEADRDGPHIEEVVDSPTRESSVLRNADRFQNIVKPNPKYLAQMQAVLAKPGFNENANYMQEMLNILTMQINDWEHDQEVYGYSENRSQSVSQWKSRRERYAQQREAALRRYYEQKSERDDSGRKEQVRRSAEMTDMRNIAFRASRTRLPNSNSQGSYNHHNRYYSSDEENDNAGRPHRRRSPSPNGTYLSNSNHQRRDQSYFQQSYHSNSSQNRRDESRAQKSYHQSSQQSREGTSRIIVESDGAAGPSTVQPRKPVRVRVGKSRVTKSHNRKWKPGQRAMMEIRKYQKSTDLLIQKAPFCRLVHEIVSSSSWFREEFRIRADALLALQEVAEAFLVECFEGSNLLAGHAKRVTITVADMQLYRRLCLRNL